MSGISRYKGLYRSMPLYRAGVLVRRPSFYGNGTNGTDYALFVWKKENGKFVGSGTSFGTDLIYYDRSS
jgi:hypothetical protein